MILLLASALASTPLASWDLQQDDGGFAAGGELGQWSWGIVTAGPGAGYDGSRAWAVGLAGPYLNDSVEYLELPLPSLAGAVLPVFSFEQWYGFGKGDYGYLEIDEGAGFHAVAPVYGYPYAQGWAGQSAGWEQATVQLPPGAERVRFVFVSDVSGVGVGWFIDNPGVWDGDVTPPRVSALDALPDTEELTTPYTVNATVEDDTHVASATLVWSTSRGAAGSVPMADQGGNTWRATLPVQLPDTTVSYHVVATDGANSTTWPTTGEDSFRVYLAAPTGLSGPEGRVVGTTVPLTWTPPESLHEVTGYQVLRDGTVVAEATEPAATVAVTGEDDTFTVRALYAAGAGDASEPWSVAAVLPGLAGVDPASGYAGDHLWVEVFGDNAQFVDGEVSVDFGAGITTEGVSVRDVDRLVAELSVDAAATPGDRTVLVESHAGPLSLPAGFTVEDAALRPRLTAIEPDTVSQGASGTLTVTYVGELATTPTVSLGEGLVVEAVRIAGDTLQIDYVAAVKAPVGLHAVTADDGVRQLDGVNLTLRDWTPAPVQTCSTGGAAPAGVGVLIALGLALGRRRT